jgi:muramoyltetrapeptide carboxypeptidase
VDSLQTQFSLLIPPFLKPGDTVAVVSPASRLPYEALEAGLRVLRDDWQLTVLEGDSLRAADGPFAGSDALRRADLQRFFDDPSVKAVFASRGGYGCYRIADDLDLTGLRANPKWLVGFSDVTVLLSLLYRHGLPSLHGIMPGQFGRPERAGSLALLRQWLFGEAPTHYATPPHALNRVGQASGPLLGGNLTMLINSIDTPTDLPYEGAVLFLEDIDETLFSLDRMMRQLHRSGRLAGLAGLVVGQFSDMRSNPSLPFGTDAYGIIAEVVANYRFPVLMGLPAGHDDENLPLPIGQKVDLLVDASGGVLRF